MTREECLQELLDSMEECRLHEIKLRDAFKTFPQYMQDEMMKEQIYKDLFKDA